MGLSLVRKGRITDAELMAAFSARNKRDLVFGPALPLAPSTPVEKPALPFSALFQQAAPTPAPIPLDAKPIRALFSGSNQEERARRCLKGV